MTDEMNTINALAIQLNIFMVLKIVHFNERPCKLNNKGKWIDAKSRKISPETPVVYGAHFMQIF